VTLPRPLAALLGPQLSLRPLWQQWGALGSITGLLGALAFFCARLILDLLWWIPGSIASLNLMELFTGGATALFAALFVADIRRHERHPCLLAFVPYVVVLGFGGMRNLELRAGMEILVKYISPLLLMFLISGWQNTPELRRRFLWVTSAVITIPVLVSLHHWLTGHHSSFELQGYRRLLGGYQNLHNHALMMMAFTSLAAWWFFQVKGRRNQAAMALFAAAALAVLYLTYVRTALVALAAFLGAFLFLSGRRPMLAAGIIVGSLFIASTPAMQDRFKDLVLFFVPGDDVVDKRKLGSGRWGIWTASVGEYLARPVGDIVFGLGIGKHYMLTAEAYNPLVLRKGGSVDAHSDYLTMTFQVGPIATLCYLSMQAQILRSGLRVLRGAPDLRVRQFAAYVMALNIGSVAANMVSNAFINRVSLGWFFWAMVGLLFAAERDLDKNGAGGPPGAEPQHRVIR
jgi:O-Antigen ligase